MGLEKCNPLLDEALEQSEDYSEALDDFLDQLDMELDCNSEAADCWEAWHGDVDHLRTCLDWSLHCRELGVERTILYGRLLLAGHDYKEALKEATDCIHEQTGEEEE